MRYQRRTAVAISLRGARFLEPDVRLWQVHVEFWQRTEAADPHRVHINRHCIAVFTLDGELDTVKFFEE